MNNTYALAAYYSNGIESSETVFMDRTVVTARPDEAMKHFGQTDPSEYVPSADESGLPLSGLCVKRVFA